MLALCLLVAGAALAENLAENLAPGLAEDPPQGHQKDDKGNWIHNYDVKANEDAVLVWPTCEENGLIRFTCTYASDYEPAEELKPKKDFQEYVVYSEGHDYPETWKAAVALVGTDRVVSYTPATCTEPGSITVKCGHQEKHLEYRKNVKFYGYSKCDATKTYKIPATGHVWSDSKENNDPTKPKYKVVDEATCTKKGLMVNYCIHCDVNGENTVVTDMIPHDWEDDDPETTPATCVADGKTVFSHTCKVCKKHETSEDEDNDGLPATVIHAKDPTAHVWDREPDEAWHEDYTQAVEDNPNVCYIVKEYRLCKACHNAKEERERDVAHNKSDWKTTKKATCFETGKEVRKCLNDGCKYKEENELPINPKNHPAEYRVKDPDASKEPTCTEDGLYVYDCTACKDIEGSEWKAAAKKTIDKLGHIEKIVILNGTCAKTEADELPNLTVTYCIRDNPECDGELVDKTGIWAAKKDQYKKLNPNAEVFSTTIFVNVLSVVEGEVPDHDWTEWKNRNDPDDRGPGYWIRQCNDCGIHEEVISDTDPSKPDEPVEPKNGLYEEEGGLRYYVDGVASTTTGLTLIEPNNEWYYLAGGFVDMDCNEFVRKFGRQWVIKNGKLDNQNDGLIEYNGGIYAVSEGMLWNDWSGIKWIDGKNYLLSQGQWNSSYNGVVYQEGNQIVIKNGQIDFDCTSITIDGVEYPVVNGIIQFK
jgi:hypothetical protein